MESEFEKCIIFVSSMENLGDSSAKNKYVGLILTKASLLVECGNF